MRIKKTVLGIAWILLMLLSVGMLLRGCTHASFQQVQISTPVEVPTNYIQGMSPLDIAAYDGKLYIYPKVKDDELFPAALSFPHGSSLYAFCSGYLQTVGKGIPPDYGNYHGMKDGYIYYTRREDEEDCWCAVAYHIGEEREYLLMKDTKSDSMLQAYTGQMYIRGKDDLYYPVEGITVGKAVVAESVMTLEPEYKLGEYTYSYTADGYIVCYDSNGVLVDLGHEFRWDYIIPCEKGLLIAEYYGAPLHLVRQEDNEIVTLVDYSVTTCDGIAVYGDDVYITTIDGERSGVYRVSLTDYSIDKLSDTGYWGLYIFDDTGIFAVDPEGSIDKLDWDGNCVQTVLKVVDLWDVSIWLPFLVILLLLSASCVVLWRKIKKDAF